MQRLTFVHEGERRSIALEHVVAVIDAPRLRRLPRVAGLIAGLLDAGARIVPAIGTSGHVALIVTAGAFQFALLAERVEELVDGDDETYTAIDPREVLEQLRAQRPAVATSFSASSDSTNDAPTRSSPTSSRSG